MFALTGAGECQSPLTNESSVFDSYFFGKCGLQFRESNQTSVILLIVQSWLTMP